MMDLITEHIDIWTLAQIQKKNGGRGRSRNSNENSAHGIKKLRELILELSVRGKLVPQDPVDEPVRTLLEKIEEEKTKLIKEGIIKRQKPLAKISANEKPYELPASWHWVRLGDVGKIFNGNSVNARMKEAKYTNIENGLPFIATKDIGYGWEALDYNNGISIPKNEPKFKVAHKGAVFICAEGGSAGKKCGITRRDVCFGNKLYANELYGDIASDYILAIYLSPTFYTQFSEQMTGIIGGISAAKFNHLVVPLPPLAEQQRIVAKVDELMALCDKLEQQQTDSNATHQTLVETLLTTLTNAAGQTEFTDTWQRIADHFDTLFTTEQSIEQLTKAVIELAVNGSLIKFNRDARKCTVKEILFFGPRNGLSPKESSFKTNIKVLKLGATTKGYLDLEESKYVDIKVDEISHLWVRNGDILIQRGNAAAYVGCNVLIEDIPPNFIYPDLMMKLRANDTVIPQYLSICLSAPSSRKHMWDKMTGTSGTMPKISKKVVESVPLFIPDKETQERVILFVKNVFEIIEQLRSELSDINITQTQLADTVVRQVHI